MVETIDVSSPLSHTACVFEKNYRLQDIQLSKIRQCRIAALAGTPPKRSAKFVALPAEASRDAKPQGEAKAGGEYRARTGDLLVANQALSQLS